MEIAVGVPEREHAVSRLSFRDAAYALGFSKRIFSVDVVECARVDKCVIKSRIEYFLVFFASAFHLYSRQIILPSCFGHKTDLVEIAHPFL